MVADPLRLVFPHPLTAAARQLPEEPLTASSATAQDRIMNARMSYQYLLSEESATGVALITAGRIPGARLPPSILDCAPQKHLQMWEPS